MSDFDTIAEPRIFIKDGQVLASSRDVAAFFGKEHSNVLRLIDSIIQEVPSVATPPAHFCAGVYTLPEAGPQCHRLFNMTRLGFIFLVMGFTGRKARKRDRYIQAFAAAQAQLYKQPQPEKVAVAMLNDPPIWRKLLLNYSERVIGAGGRVQEMERQPDQIQPQVQALEATAASHGSLSITDAAKILQVRPQALFQFLRSHHWIYSRPGDGADLAYQSKLVEGLLEHKITTITRWDGTEETVTQVRITPKGLTRLSVESPRSGGWCRSPRSNPRRSLHQSGQGYQGRDLAENRAALLAAEARISRRARQSSPGGRSDCGSALDRGRDFRRGSPCAGPRWQSARLPGWRCRPARRAAAFTCAELPISWSMRRSGAAGGGSPLPPRARWARPSTACSSSRSRSARSTSRRGTPSASLRQRGRRCSARGPGSEARHARELQPHLRHPVPGR